ncbi:MAG: hypothetical protein QXL51_07960 [Candidatus Aenigmatarchaeota archaeon]
MSEQIAPKELVYKEKSFYVYGEKPFSLKILSYLDRRIQKSKVVKALEWAKSIIINDYLEENQFGQWEAFEEGSTSFSLTLFFDSDVLDEEIEVSNLRYYKFTRPLIDVEIKVREDEIFEARKRALQMINKFLSLLK